MIDPRGFYDRHGDDFGLGGPAVVIGLIALVGFLAAIPTILAVNRALPPRASALAAVFIGISAVIGALVPFVVWVVYAVLFYLLSLAFDGEGSFTDLLGAIGWGFAPRVISGVVGVVVSFVFLSGVDFSDPQSAARFSNQLATSPLGLVSRGISVLTTLWAGWIWTHAVARTRDLSVRNAAIVVGIVVGAGLVISLGSTYLL